MATSDASQIDGDTESWDDDREDDFWKDADKDVMRDADGHVVVSEEGKRIDVTSYRLGWSLVIGTGILVALIATVVGLVAR